MSRWGALFGLLFVYGVLPSRLASMGRELWLDEVAANRLILDARGLLELRRMVWWQFQPLLDYALRKYAFFPVFGAQELGLRLPNALFSLAALFFCVERTHAYLSKRFQASVLPALGCLVVGFWWATLPLERWYAVEAKSYSLASLLSLLWAWSFVLDAEDGPTIAFTLLSAFFLNAHFFAFPLAGAAYAYFAATDLRQRNHRQAARTAGVFLALAAATIMVNYPALHAMFATAPVPSSGGGLREGLALWRGLLASTEGRADVGGIILVVAVGSSRSLKLAALALLAAPLSFVAMRALSAYPFQERYYMPFLGIAFAANVLCVEGLLAPLDRLRRLDRLRWKPVAAAAGLAALFFFSPARRPWAWPKADFTRKFAFFEGLKTGRKQTFVIASPCYAQSIADFYWRRLGAPPESDLGHPARMRSEAECRAFSLDAQQIRDPLASFLRSTRDGVVVFIQIHAPCPSHAGPAPDPAAGSRAIAVERVDGLAEFGGGSCLWRVSGASSPREVEAVAKAEGFPAAIDLTGPVLTR